MQIRVRLINEVITAILEICWSSWEQREKSDLSKIEVCKYIESTKSYLAMIYLYIYINYISDYLLFKLF
jgi:hypothetical protein